MIKPVTYQGVFNFAANLYALEVKSRFIDQSKANGYYKGYGTELAATVVGQQIKIDTGAFVVQGRMNEVTSPEMLSPQIFDGFVGYVCARVETYHPSDDDNCTFVVYVNRTFDAINLRQDDIYAADADNVNKVYELPIYSFEISGTNIVKLNKLIGAVDDYAKIKAIVDNALATAQTAMTTANGAVTTANAANTKADNAVTTANAANTKADNAVTTANAANTTANTAAATVAEQHEQMTAEIDELSKAIAEGQGSIIKDGEKMLAVYNIENVVETVDEIIITGGDV